MASVPAGVNAAKMEIGQMADRLAYGYLAFHAAISVGTHPDANELLPPKGIGGLVSVGAIPREDGSRAITYNAQHYRDLAREPAVAREYGLVWLSGAMMSLNDELSQYDHFDRQPEYELVRHLRNAVAHGNRFRIDRPERLATFPAYWPGCKVDGTSDHKQRRFEITPQMNGDPCLFEFIGESDVQELLQAVGHRLRFDATTAGA